MLTPNAFEKFISCDYDGSLSIYHLLSKEIGRKLYLYNMDLCYRLRKSTINDVTAIIKTFERPECLHKLIISINKYYPTLKVIIADSSLQPNKSHFPDNYKYIWVGFDKGLSYGRNHALSLVETKFFLLLDDDFVFYENTVIENLIDSLCNNHLDIVGGLVLEDGKLMNYYSDYNIFENSLIQKPPKNESILTKCDIVLNFFLGKTDEVKIAGGWDNRLKLAEHTDFFVNAKTKGLRTGYIKNCTVLHEPVRKGDYIEYRKRGVFFTEVMMLKYGLNSIVNIHGTRYEKKGIDKRQLAINSKMLYHNEGIADSHLSNAFEIGKKLNIPFFISNGTLLGMIRESSYIGHDTDIDIGVMEEDFKLEILNEFINVGFSVFGIYGKLENGYEISLIKDNIKLDIFVYYREGNSLVMSVWDGDNQIKYKYTNFTLREDVFRNFKVFIPSDPYRYLKEQYGENWMVPVVSWDWKSSPHNIRTDV